jgi:hypothetical protein
MSVIPAPAVLDPLDGKTEIRFPSEAMLKAYWDADIVDVHGVEPGTIISVDDAFLVRFRIDLRGGLWRCITGTWCFDVGFTPVGKGTGFDLSEHLGSELTVPDWRGCKDLYVSLEVPVPAGTIPAHRCATLYSVGAKFQLKCCDRPAPVVGYETLGAYEFYKPE